MTASNKPFDLGTGYDLNALVASPGMFEVKDPVHGPGSGRWFVDSSVSGRNSPTDKRILQLAYELASGDEYTRVLVDGSWSDWATSSGGGGGGGGTAATTTFDDTIYSAAGGTDPNLPAIFGALTVDPPTNVQDAINGLLYYSAIFVGAATLALASLPGGTGLANNLVHTTNPQTVSISGYNVQLNTDGTGGAAHHAVLPVGADLLQRVELAANIQETGDTIILQSSGGTQLCHADNTNLATLTFSTNSHVALLEWVKSINKWRLVDYNGVVIA